MSRRLRNVITCSFWGFVVMGCGLHGCTNRLGPVYATQTAGGPDNPNLADNMIEHTKECMETYGWQLATGRTLLESKVDLNESGDNVNVTIMGIPETAPDFGACIRNVLRDITVPEQSFREAVARLKYRREHVVAADSVVNLPGVTIAASVPILSSDLVLEVDAYSIVLQVSVKVVDKVVKPIDLDKQTLARLGRVALAGLGYDEIIKRAEKLGWVKTVPIEQALSAAGKSYIGSEAAVAAAQDRAAKLFTRYAVTAGITSQVDSPLPGLADAVALGILVAGMLHAGGVMVDEIIAAEQAEAAASAAPSAVASTTAPVATVAKARKYPNQTCEDDERERLDDEMHEICNNKKRGFAAKCNPKKERVDDIPCSAVKLSIQQRQACLAARWVVQNKCFGGKPDKNHQDEIDNVQNGIDQCKALEPINCAKGHPMADK
jgi:Novel toxin 16